MQTVVVFGVPYTPDFYNIGGGAVTVIFSIFPWDPLAKGFNDLGSATISDTAPGVKCAGCGHQTFLRVGCDISGAREGSAEGN